MYSNANLQNKTLWIIGANSDIAKAFAADYSKNFKEVILASRNISLLKSFTDTNRLCNCKTFGLDITDNDSVDDFISASPLPDIILFCAGHVKYDGESEDFNQQNIENTIRINFEASVQFLEKASAIMKQNQKGQIVVISSVAGERGKTTNRIYSAAKAGLTVYAEGLAQSCSEYNVTVSVLKPGHINTKMLRSISPKKQIFSCETDKSAKVILSIINKNKSTDYYCTGIWRLISAVLNLIPDSIYNKMKL